MTPSDKPTHTIAQAFRERVKAMPLDPLASMLAEQMAQHIEQYETTTTQPEEVVYTETMLRVLRLAISDEPGFIARQAVECMANSFYDFLLTNYSEE